jgi:hypothetical protein
MLLTKAGESRSWFAPLSNSWRLAVGPEQSDSDDMKALFNQGEAILSINITKSKPEQF